MQKVDPHDIQNLLQGAATSGNTSVPSFGPVAEGLTVYANNTERMNKGLVANVVRNIYYLYVNCQLLWVRGLTLLAAHRREQHQRRCSFRTFLSQ